MRLSALQLAEASASRAEARTLEYTRLTVPQRAFVSCLDREAAWVDGNQLGKSFALAWDLVHRCRGTHPYAPGGGAHRPPITAVVVGVSYEQMVPLMEKVWQLLPKHEIDPKVQFEPGRGISGKPPRILFVRGPGRGSLIVFATYNQGVGRLAGGTYHLVVLDEPPPESLYGEVGPRLLRNRGVLRIGMTPLPDMPDVTWLRKKCEAGQIARFNFGLRVEHLVPEGYPAPWLYQEDLDEYAAGLLEHEREMRINGAWEPVVTGRWLRAFTRSLHVLDVPLANLRGWTLVVGMDHGTADGKQCAVLIAVRGGSTDRPEVVYLDEEVAEGFTTPEHDAEAVLRMLSRNGLAYDAVDAWIGDVPTGSKRWQVRKSNSEIRKELGRQLGRPLHTLRPIDAPRKHAGSLTAGMRLMNTLFTRRHPDGSPMVRIRPRCVHFLAGVERFAGDTHDPVKDALDAGRYATERAITGPVTRLLVARY